MGSQRIQIQVKYVDQYKKVTREVCQVYLEKERPLSVVIRGIPTIFARKVTLELTLSSPS